MMPALKHEINVQPPTRQICLLTDGNAHRTDLFHTHNGFFHRDIVSESMLPEIRLMAQMIAASRHDFNQHSPKFFTEEADWFAARLLVLQVESVHLDLTWYAVLQEANSRAAEFAQQHSLPFQAAFIRPSLNTKRPLGVWIANCRLQGNLSADWIQNSLNLRHEIVKMM
ncbi:MAG: hypothetical protein Q4B82_07940 [Alysiella sp.]|uniref:hypothetical protein n=1 Tax=Alysiella sp. TaxID=1872483 RepID=UPI0026DD0C81|nr:hypothetical protein [Alysiella sp.]MDO4434492.1 hypothetical protein [Alysiella sp.]